mmetsp:Transcript_10665/g.33078  ORF Transcript_10665/g.33078 Transcript_10665/m.33078 type:complete len:281 (+) Transcript_10665:61-903(+)
MPSEEGVAHARLDEVLHGPPPLLDEVAAKPRDEPLRRQRRQGFLADVLHRRENAERVRVAVAAQGQRAAAVGALEREGPHAAAGERRRHRFVGTVPAARHKVVESDGLLRLDGGAHDGDGELVDVNGHRGRVLDAHDNLLKVDPHRRCGVRGNQVVLCDGNRRRAEGGAPASDVAGASARASHGRRRVGRAVPRGYKAAPGGSATGRHGEQHERRLLLLKCGVVALGPAPDAVVTFEAALPLHQLAVETAAHDAERHARRVEAHAGPCARRLRDVVARAQ